MKYAHVACEILTSSNNNRLTHAIADDSNLINLIFQYLDVPSGHLDTGVAITFSKLLVALLKSHHVLVINHMTRKGHSFVQSLVRHVDSLPIADLIVRILDGPESVDGNGNGAHIPVGSLYGSNPSFQAHNVIRKPTQEALDLLASADIFGQLASSFVTASETQSAMQDDDENQFKAANTTTAAVDSAKDSSTDALLGKHPLSKEGSGSERPAQKPRSEEDDENATMSDQKGDDDSETMKEANDQTFLQKDSGSAKAEGESASKSEPDDSPTSSIINGEQASPHDTAETSPTSVGHAALNAPGTQNDPELDTARRRRLREETMANATSTILDLTERMLRLPSLGCEIPEKLNIFATPIVISRLIDAGIFARCNGAMEPLKGASTTETDMVAKSNEEHQPSETPEDAAHEQRLELFTSGGSTALLHALKLAAQLLTTEFNVYRDEEGNMGDGGMNVVSMGLNNHQFGGLQNSQNAAKMMMMVMNASGGRLGPINMEADGTNSSSSPSSSSNQDSATANSILSQKRDGDRLIPTDDLEAELEQRFERLAQMLDDGEAVSNSKINANPSSANATRRPLGSLRLMLAEFFVACIKQSSQKTVNRIMELEVPKTLLLLFDQYRWSSMLHGVVTSAIKECLLGGPIRRSGRLAWFEAGLIPWMMDVWRRNSIEEGEMDAPKGGRCGYLGHLIRIGKDLKSLLDEKDDNLLPSPTKTSPSTGADDDASPIKKAKEFVTINNPLGMPRQEEADQFRAFAEVMLEPAVQRESKPLCGENGVHGSGSGGDLDGSGQDGEEATDVLVIGGIQFVEGLSRDDKLDDDEDEIKPVDTAFEDLPQFGSEDIAVVESVTGSGNDSGAASGVDHDIPPEMRKRIGESKKGESSRRKSSEHSINEDESNLNNIKGFKTKEDGKRSSDSDHASRKSGGRSSSRSPAGDQADNKDSSSEDEGSYIAFVDDRKGRSGSKHESPKAASSSSSSSESSKSSSSSPSGSARGVKSAASGSSASSQYVTGKLASQMGKMNMADDKDEAPSASLDGVVIEIDDEENDVIEDLMTPPPPPPAPPVPPAPISEEEASSDEDYESWESYSNKSKLAAASGMKRDTGAQLAQAAAVSTASSEGQGSSPSSASASSSALKHR